jgi:hypothetical protein
VSEEGRKERVTMGEYYTRFYIYTDIFIHI